MTTVDQNTVWLGRAHCALTNSHNQYSAGYRGAFVVFACRAENITLAVDQFCRELAEHNLIVIGFEYLENQPYMERGPEGVEIALIEKLETYPVQFADVHIYKPDG